MDVWNDIWPLRKNRYVNIEQITFGLLWERAAGRPGTIVVTVKQLQERFSRDAWCQLRWPLIEKRMTRHQCGLWMMEHGYPQPPRSACVYCPFHRNEEWRRLQIEEPEAFAAAVEFEGKLQAVHARTIPMAGKIAGVPFLHRSCKPLATVDFRGDQERGQTCLWQDECCGVCGV